jgi:phytol kinase
MNAAIPGLVAVSVAFLLLVAALAAWGRRHRADPEVVRKGLHVGMGLACLALPWLFDRLWPVAALAAAFAAGLALRDWCPPVRRTLGPILDGVQRSSKGEVLFPIAVALLFMGAGADPLAFLIPILILALADSAAALVGRRFGASRYGGPNAKSVQGSVAFFTIALGCTGVPLGIHSALRLSQIVLISFSVALLATLAEAVSRHGLDNLSVPLITLLLVRTLPSLGLLPLALVLAGSCTLALLGAAAVTRSGTSRPAGSAGRPVPGTPRVMGAGLPAAPLRSGQPETRRQPCRT